jgi:hypothetical protein
MNRRRIVGAVLSLSLLSAVPAAAQTPLIKLTGDFTVAFTGDDLEELDGAIGFGAGLLLPMGDISYLGIEGGWSDVSFEGSTADASLFEVGGLARIGLGYSESYRPYVDLRAGYGRLSYEGLVDASVGGPAAGATAGFMIRAGRVWFDLHGGYQHLWFDDAELEGFIFDAEASGGRVLLGVGVGIPLGGR